MSITKQNGTAESRTARVIRVFLLGLLIFSIVGTGTELVLLEHTEDVWQWVPLVLMAVCLLVVGWVVVAPARASLRTFQSLMGLFVLSGLVGLVLHYRGNAEFELEMYPSLSGLGLFWEAIRGATPTLAPGTMVQLGLLGLAFTYRHPALTPPERRSDHELGD